MGLKTMIADLSSLFGCTAGMNSECDPARSEMQPFYLPFPQGGMIPHLLVLTPVGKISYWISRVAPIIYERIMARQLKSELE